MFDIDTLRGGTYATIRAAFNTSKEILEEYGDMGSANITGIMTRIMQDVGRFSERWSSDALYGLDNLRDIAGKASRLDGPFDEIFAFGIRKDGVDGNAFLVQRIADTRDCMAGYVFPERVYRRVLAVRARVSRENGRGAAQARFSLRDLTHSFHGIDRADLEDPDDRMSKIRNIPFANLESPEPAEPRHRTDAEDVEKLKAQGYKSFNSREIPMTELAAEGCEGDIKCVEVGGLYDPRVPAPKDPSGCAVCRVYLAGGNIIVAWLDHWYRSYDGAKAEIEKAKAALLKTAAGREGEDGGDGE